MESAVSKWQSKLVGGMDQTIWQELETGSRRTPTNELPSRLSRIATYWLLRQLCIDCGKWFIEVVKFEPNCDD